MTLRKKKYLFTNKNKNYIIQVHFYNMNSYRTNLFNLFLLLCKCYDVNVQKHSTKHKMRETLEIYSVLQDNQLKVNEVSCFQLLLIVFNFNFLVIYQQDYCSIQTLKLVNYSLTSHFRVPESNLRVTGPRSHLKSPESHLIILGSRVRVPSPA